MDGETTDDNAYNNAIVRELDAKAAMWQAIGAAFGTWASLIATITPTIKDLVEEAARQAKKNN